MKRHHSLPLSVAERQKRIEQAAEHARFGDVFGDFKITRNTANYITKVEKVAEDIVVEDNYTRNSDNYITDICTRILIKKKVG